MSLRFLSASCSQSAADTYTEAEMATGLANLSLAYRVRGIHLQVPVPVETDSNLGVILLRRSAGSAVNINDRRVLWRINDYSRITTSGAWVNAVEHFQFLQKDLELLIVEDPIFIGVFSAATGLANTVLARVYYEEVRISETAKLAALTESLNP